VGGTDKMSAAMTLGWVRTYAKLDPNKPFTYDAWAEAVRAGRTFSSTGPLIDMTVEGHDIGDTIQMGENGGTVEIEATAESAWPLGKLEIVYNGKAIETHRMKKGDKRLAVKTKFEVPGSGWLAARCIGPGNAVSHAMAAHTSPVYIKCGDTRAFDGPAAQHMLALVEGSIEYMQTLATVYDEASRKRLLKLFNEVRKELGDRLVVEAQHHHHHGHGEYHHHGAEGDPGHTH